MDDETSWDEEWSDVEYYDDDDYDNDNDETDTIECPECRADIYEDAEQCPSCGHYIIASQAQYAWKGRPMWWIVLGFLGILAVIYALAFQF